ncbi:FHA domain-containing protein [Tautonia sp. JC769]|uniref:FHA domain-containing protein n=1 Tax=Tautonia sp. JC769 TaxID=3232135 RepID=UPI003459AD69
MTQRGLDRFWEAIGSAPPFRLLVWHRSRHGPIEHCLPRPFALIGRTSPADLVLDHPQISRRHAFVQVIGRRAYCLDLGSRSALAWNGRPRRSGWIEPGQFVEIGPFRIGLPVPATASPRPGPTDAPLPSPSPDLRVLLEPSGQGSPAHRPVVIDRVFTLIGRAPECDLRLSDLSISRYHCLLIRLGRELWVVDLLGRGGVEVDSRPVPWAILDDASSLRLGRDLFTVRLVPSSPRSPADRLGLPYTPPNPSDRPGLAGNPAAGPVDLPALIERPSLPAPMNFSPPVALEDPQQAELSRLAESMIAPVIDQFTAMQQHLFDQYHQSMMEMMAVFARLHHEQQGLVDRELRKIRRLTREVRALRRELDQHRETAAAAPQHTPPQSPGSHEPITPARRGEPSGTPEDYRAAQARIIARMTELQQERQGRWQRLLGRLGSGSVEQDR